MLFGHSCGAGSGLDVATIEAQPGTYALVHSTTGRGLIRIGRPGELRLQSGFYVYVGSALGHWGVGARFAHQMKPSGRPHWHIDYLRKHAVLLGISEVMGRHRKSVA